MTAEKTPLEKRLEDMIAADGPMPVSRYMQLCLHDPAHGYYSRGAGIGRDFTTAPESSQIFGELLGAWLAEGWQRMGRPDPVRIAELGPGSGQLMADMIRIWRRVPGLLEAARITLVEASPALQEQQSVRLNNLGADVSWDGAVEGLPPDSLLLVANEFLDCLPVRQFVQAGGAWQERVVGVSDGRLAFGLTQSGRGPMQAERTGSAAAEVQPGLENLVSTLARRAESAPLLCLFIDYGAGAGDPAPADTLRSYREGAAVPPLHRPGECDLTADVDFPRLARLARRAGLAVQGPTEQGRFLWELGAEARARALMDADPDAGEIVFEGARTLIEPDRMGQRFKVLALSSPALKMPGFQL